VGERESLDLKLDFKEFPPGVKHIKVSLSSREAAVAALTLYSPCRPRAVWMRHTAFVLLRLVGARALPGRAIRWEPPMGREEWLDLCNQWRAQIGPFDGFAIGERAQQNRSGFFVLLLQRGRPTAFVKIRARDAGGLAHEYAVTQRVWAASPRSFSVPEPLALDRRGDWHYLAVAPLTSVRHGVPRDPPLGEIASEIGDALRDLPRHPDCPDHWVPMHGDLTPWNLRELPDRRLVLFDWEDAAWAPPGADEVLYRVSNAAVGNAIPGRHAAREAVRFWADRIGARVEAGRRDEQLQRSLLRMLRLMDAPLEGATAATAGRGG